MCQTNVVSDVHGVAGFHLENCPRGEGGNWRNQDFKGGMMVKYVTKFYRRLLGGSGYS